MPGVQQGDAERTILSSPALVGDRRDSESTRVSISRAIQVGRASHASLRRSQPIQLAILLCRVWSRLGVNVLLRIMMVLRFPFVGEIGQPEDESSFRLGTPMLNVMCPASMSTAMSAGSRHSVTMTLRSEPSGSSMSSYRWLRERTAGRPVRRRMHVPMLKT